MKTLCEHCLAEYDERPGVCGSCGEMHYLRAMPTRVGGRAVALSPRRRTGLVSARDLAPDTSLAPYGEPWSAWRLGGQHALLLVGPPGCGKSTAATALACSAARQWDVLYVASEEGHSVALRERLSRCGVTDLAARRLVVSDARDLDELSEDLERSSARLVVLDSVSELRATPLAVVERLRGRSLIAVQHVNARGGGLGGHEWAHAVDCVVHVEDGVACPRKNRFGGMSSIRIWEVSNVG